MTDVQSFDVRQVYNDTGQLTPAISQSIRRRNASNASYKPVKIAAPTRNVKSRRAREDKTHLHARGHATIDLRSRHINQPTANELRIGEEGQSASMIGSKVSLSIDVKPEYIYILVCIYFLPSGRVPDFLGLCFLQTSTKNIILTDVWTAHAKYHRPRCRR